jgi:cytoskeletal protein RodZ
MSNLRNPDREAQGNTVIDSPTRRGNSFLSFALGMMFMAVIVLGGAVAYLLYQRNLFPSQPAETPNASPQASVEESPANNPSSPETPQPANSSSESSITSFTSESKPLNLQVNHANGTVMRVTGVALADDSTTIEVAVTNGSKYEIELNQTNNSMIMTDNLGSQYNLSPPANNPSLTIKPGTSLKGKFVFLGRFNPSATTITLTTNSRHGGDKDYSRDPKMQVDIPVNNN